MADEELLENIRRANGEFSAAIVLLVSLLQKIAVKLDDPAFTNSVELVKEHVKGIPGRVPPGCRLPLLDELPEDLRNDLSQGWKDFFNQQPVP